MSRKKCEPGCGGDKYECFEFNEESGTWIYCECGCTEDINGEYEYRLKIEQKGKPYDLEAAVKELIPIDGLD